jgi:hypothetical protein
MVLSIVEVNVAKRFCLVPFPLSQPTRSASADLKLTLLCIMFSSEAS